MTVSANLDAVIIGAGPAGSAAAILLARAGWAVALIEKQRFPRRKVCGECIAASNLPLLDALGIGAAVAANAGPALRRVTLLHERQQVSADLPAADHGHHPWGRALGRERLDSMLLDQARAAGATVLQPWSVMELRQASGIWHCKLRAVDSGAALTLRAAMLIDAHGAWQSLGTDQPLVPAAPAAADLFAFKANFSGAALRTDTISVLALDGGYGGMVVADGGVTTVATASGATGCMARAVHHPPSAPAMPSKPGSSANPPGWAWHCGTQRARASGWPRGRSGPEYGSAQTTSSSESATRPAKPIRYWAKASAWRCNRRRFCARTCWAIGQAPECRAPCRTTNCNDAMSSTGIGTSMRACVLPRRSRRWRCIPGRPPD